VQAVLEDWRAAPVTPQVRATLGFLERMTLAPEQLGPDDSAAVRAADVGEEAFLDAIYIGALFSMIVRVADALDFDVPPFSELLARAGERIQRGYELMTVQDS
jgi:alkylhydroperoxidase family enzyme